MTATLPTRWLERHSVPLPRSLLWRIFLLVALLMLMSVGAWYAIYATYEREPRARQLAQTLVSVANLTRVTLVSARVDARLSVLRELSDREGIHIYPAEASDNVARLSGDPLLQSVFLHVREALGERTRMTLNLNGESGLFVSFKLEDDDEEEFWVVLPRDRMEHRFPLTWVGWGLAVLALSLVGAWLIVFHISRPLRHLAEAARKVGAAETPPVLPEDGPDEISDVAKAFNQMSADLAQLDQDRALVLAGISHDLRTPLTRLRMGIELTGDAGMRDDMCADVDEMDTTISQFLDFARADSGEPVATVPLDEMLDEIVERYQRRHVAVSVAVPPSSTLEARPKALRRAITNLIDNAVRYAPRSPIEVQVTPEGDRFQIDVMDRGPGIPVNEVERLKRPFTRLEAARTNVVGAGLGLAIIDRIVRAHGGRFELHARDGGGLVARLVLPRSQHG